MVIKRKDFQKAAAFIHEFLLKLSEDVECAEVRDTLNLALLHMQKYYRLIQSRSQEKNGHMLSLTARGLSPMTPFVDAPDKFIWRWVNLDSVKNSTNMSLVDSVNFVVLPPLIDAAKNGDIDLLSDILQEDPSCIDCTDGLGRTAVMYAVHFFRHDALRCLLEHRADVNAQAHDESTAMHRACHDANHIALKMLVDHDGNFTVCDVHGRAPIHWAVTTRSTECLQILLKHGASVGTRDKDMLTPSMWACRMDNILHFELLCQADHKVEEHDGIERDASGRTWMHWSVRRSQPLECLQTLLTPDSAAIKDKDGKTVLLLAAEMGSLHACRVILEIAGDQCIEDQDNQGRTALHVATMGGHGDVVNFLLEKNADVNVVDSYNATPWDYARIRKLHYCQLIIMSHQRQRMANDPLSRLPNGLGLFLRGESDDGHNDLNKMGLTSRSSRSTPATPPHPPKRPRSSRILVRRANSLTTPDRERVIRKEHGVTDSSEEKLFISGGQREQVLVGVSASNKRSSIGDVFFNTRESTAVTDSSKLIFDDESEDISVDEGMEVSDVEDNDEAAQPSTQTSRGPLQTLRPRPPPRRRPDDLIGPSPPLSEPIRGDHGSHVFTNNRNNSSVHTQFQNLKPQPAHQMKFDGIVSSLYQQKENGGPKQVRPQARVPPTPIYKSSRGGPVPTPPSATPQRPHMIRHQQPLPSSIPRGVPPQHQQSHDPLSPSPSRESPSLSSQSSDLQQHSSRSPGDRPGSGNNQPPGILEGFRIPPPALSPLQNAPRLPDPDTFDRKIKKKRKKERQEGKPLLQKPETLSDIPPPLVSMAPLHPHNQSQNVPITQANPVAMLFPKYTKGQPQISESRYVDENLEDKENPPIVKGFAVQIREGVAKSAKPTSRSGASAIEEARKEEVPEVMCDDPEEVSFAAVEDANAGPFIPPPPSFRGVPRPGTVRPLGQSVPQDNKSSRMNVMSAKPPLPKNRLGTKSSSQRSPAKSVSAGRHLTSPS